MQSSGLQPVVHFLQLQQFSEGELKSLRVMLSHQVHLSGFFADTGTDKEANAGTPPGEVAKGVGVGSGTSQGNERAVIVERLLELLLLR